LSPNCVNGKLPHYAATAASYHIVLIGPLYNRIPQLRLQQAKELLKLGGKNLDGG